MRGASACLGDLWGRCAGVARDSAGGPLRSGRPPVGARFSIQVRRGSRPLFRGSVPHWVHPRMAVLEGHGPAALMRCGRQLPSGRLTVLVSAGGSAISRVVKAAGLDIISLPFRGGYHTPREKYPRRSRRAPTAPTWSSAGVGSRRWWDLVVSGLGAVTLGVGFGGATAFPQCCGVAKLRSLGERGRRVAWLRVHLQRG